MVQHVVSTIVTNKDSCRHARAADSNGFHCGAKEALNTVFDACLYISSSSSSSSPWQERTNQ